MENFQHKDFNLGIIGGGQLGRMLIQAGIDLNINFSIIDPDKNAPCKDLVSDFSVGNLKDFDAIVEFGKKCDIITFEIEHINIDALFELELADSTGCTVSWSKDGKLIFGSGKTKVWNKHTSYFLQIKKVDIDDESLYECRVRNDYGEVMCDVQLLVDGKSYW